MRKLFYLAGLCSCFSFCFFFGYTQTQTDSTIREATLQQCIDYALKHFPEVQQAYIDESITEHQIRSRLAEWFPQINFDANYQNNFQLPKTYFNGTFINSGTYNSSFVGFSATQNIFNRDVLLASRSANDLRRHARQTTASNKIDVVVNVSKAFFDVLLTKKQIELLAEDSLRLARSLKDAYNQYVGGIVDKTDYKQAAILLNNTRAQKRTYEEMLKTKVAYLKQQMGVANATTEIIPQYDSAQMEKDVLIDTNGQINYSNRIEFQLLETQKRLQIANLDYNRWSFLPSVSAFADYNLYYLNNGVSKLYNQDFPNSYAGLQIAFPIFQGGQRIHNIRIAELQVKRVDWDIESVKTNINTQYVEALANYKSYLNDYALAKENVGLATEVYNTVQLQYRAGIKVYLDVITAESNLRDAQSNYANALYNVLSSKFDVEKALGTIKFN